MHLDPRDAFGRHRNSPCGSRRIGHKIERAPRKSMIPETRGPLSFPPPLFYVAALLIGLLLNRLWPVSLLPASWSYLLGALVIIASGAIIVPAFARFRRTRTPFNVRKPASALITDGPYRFSRNPGYVSLTLLYLGVALLLNSLWVLLMVAPAFLVMHLWVVPREERHLEERFGEHYLRYRRSVRRWI